jgi:two-component system OmpR family sensor kinase/two-component system sensor histidine kinase QseC
MNSLRLRLLVSLVGLLALAAAVMAAITYHNVLGETEALFDYQLQQMALSLRDQGEIDSAQADTLADQQLDFVVQIWTVDGRNIYASRPHASLPARALLGLATLNVDGRAWRTFGVATRERVIQVAQPVDIRQRLAAHAAWRSVLPLLLTTPLAALAIWWLAAQNLAPLERLAREVRSRDARSLAPVPTGDLPDELAPLASSLNALLERLRSSLDSQRAFVADAAHELRSPLTALKLQLELLRRADDADAREAARSAIAEGIARASRLVEQLLALARSEPDAVLPVERVDVVAVAGQAIDDSKAFADSRSVTIELKAERSAFVSGDAVALGLLARNLVDNAVRYSPPGSHVEVRVQQQGTKVVLDVDDSGPGIPESDHERIFDRFYRRSEATESGSGLGLAIVRSVANAHGASIGLGRAPLGGLEVSVSFPATP